MKILIASTPATGHLNPLLTIGRILIAEGHEVVGLSGSALRERIEGIGAEFRPLPAGADFDLRDFDTVAPELKNIPPGPEWLRVAMERVFVDAIPAQPQGYGYSRFCETSQPTSSLATICFSAYCRCCSDRA